MSVRERILAIRLLEKQEKQPEYTKQIGVQVSMTNFRTERIEEKND